MDCCVIWRNQRLQPPDASQPANQEELDATYYRSAREAMCFPADRSDSSYGAREAMTAIASPAVRISNMLPLMLKVAAECNAARNADS